MPPQPIPIMYEPQVTTPNTGSIYTTALCAPGVVCTPLQYPPGPHTKP